MPNPFEGTPKPINPVETAKQAVMPAEQYANIEHERPYVYEVECGKKQITYFAPGHSWDPGNPVWAQLKQKFNETKPDMVLVEGFENLPARRQEVIEAANKYSEEEVIGKMAESGLALKLAAERGIDFDSPEPRAQDEIAYLLQRGHSKDAIFAQQFFRMIPQWQQYNEKGDFKEFAEKEIEDIKKTTRWSDFEYSLKSAERIAQKFWGQGINLEDPEYYHSKVDPIPWQKTENQQTEVNAVSRNSSLFRDQYIIEKIAKHFETHNRIFIVYGASHAVMQEPAIRELMKQYEE